MLKLEIMGTCKGKASDHLYHPLGESFHTEKHYYACCMEETTGCLMIFIILSFHSNGIPNFYLGPG